MRETEGEEREGGRQRERKKGEEREGERERGGERGREAERQRGWGGETERGTRQPGPFQFQASQPLGRLRFQPYEGQKVQGVVTCVSLSPLSLASVSLSLSASLGDPNKSVAKREREAPLV